MRRKTEASIVQEEEEGRRNIAPNWRCTIATRILYLVDTLSILTCQLLLLSVKPRNLQLYLCVSSAVKGWVAAAVGGAAYNQWLYRGGGLYGGVGVYSWDLCVPFSRLTAFCIASDLLAPVNLNCPFVPSLSLQHIPLSFALSHTVFFFFFCFLFAVRWSRLRDKTLRTTRLFIYLSVCVYLCVPLCSRVLVCVLYLCVSVRSKAAFVTCEHLLLSFPFIIVFVASFRYYRYFIVVLIICIYVCVYGILGICCCCCCCCHRTSVFVFWGPEKIASQCGSVCQYWTYSKYPDYLAGLRDLPTVRGKLEQDLGQPAYEWNSNFMRPSQL